MRWNHDKVSGPWLQRFRYQPHEDRLYVETVQPSRGAILEAVKQLQLADSPVQGMSSFAGDMLTIPLEDYYGLVARNPDLEAEDKATRTAAWRRFYASSESGPYKVPTGRRYVAGGLNLG